MRKSFIPSSLRPREAEPARRAGSPAPTRGRRAASVFGRCGPVRGGFTLAELVVAVGILALMMALAGEMFSIAVHSTGQATALTNVSQRLRMVEQTLREDLAHVSRESSILAIWGLPARNYWTKAGYDADNNKDPADGYPHLADPEREEAVNGEMRMIAPRADILMFVTQRRGVRSAVFTDVTANAQQVVYGHALQTEYVADETTQSGYRSILEPNDVVPRSRLEFRSAEEVRQFPLDDGERNEPSRVPASQWHLARRSVLLTNEAPPDPDPDGRQWADTHPFDPVANEDGDWPLLAGLTDVVGLFDYDQAILPGIPAPYHGESSQAWKRLVLPGSERAADFLVRGKWARRSVLDLTPPAPIGDRIASYFLPHCASFKVEWTIDPSLYEQGTNTRGIGDRVLWFDSDFTIDPSRVYQTIQTAVQKLEALMEEAEPLEAERLQKRIDQLSSLWNMFDTDSRGRFPKDNNGNYDDIPGLFWYPSLVKLNGTEPDTDGSGNPRTAPDRFYPYALRITIDVYDENLRLDRPVRHVMVIPVGA